MDHDQVVQELYGRAAACLQKAYAPYSGFRVGCAVRGTQGGVAVGCNVENASYGASICAERAALTALVAAGELKVSLMVIVSDAAEPVTPCGICRQVLSEFSGDATVVSFAKGGRHESWHLSALFPAPFSSESLV